VQIVVTNDDGIDEPGLQVLAALAAQFGEVVVAAPRDAQSGVGHQVTEHEPIEVVERAAGRFAIAGTPVDCVRVALGELAPRARWVFSGINAGANLGLDTYVSGTVAAAREAAALGRSALALSQYIGRHRRLDWSASERRARHVLALIFERGCAPGEFWSANLPHPPDDAVDVEIVDCVLDPSPPVVRYERGPAGLEWRADYHMRPRHSGLDIDVCFGGRIALTRMRLAGESAP
jgi:5'-nucleotidase